MEDVDAQGADAEAADAEAADAEGAESVEGVQAADIANTAASEAVGESLEAAPDAGPAEESVSTEAESPASEPERSNS